MKSLIPFSLFLMLSACGQKTEQAQTTPAPKAAPEAASEVKAAPEAAPKAAPEAAPKAYVEIAESCRPGMTDEMPANNREVPSGRADPTWPAQSNEFGFKLLQTTKGNAVFSPYAIERALGMALEGACGETASEMLSALEMPNAKRLGMTGLRVEEALKAVNAQTFLEIENHLWPDRSLNLSGDFVSRLSAAYKTDATALDYAADPEKARATINQTVAQSTHERIRDLLSEGSIKQDTRLVLTNSVYFKAKWADAFKKHATTEEDFYGASGVTKAKMMHRTDLHSGRLCVKGDYAVYWLTFQTQKEDDHKGTGHYALAILLPHVDESHPMADRMKQLEATEKQLDLALHMKCEPAFYDVHLSLPRFKLQPGMMSLKETLQQLGMKKAFTSDAEFGAMLDPASKPAASDLKISDVLHKAFIEIDEEGGEAAAATSIVTDNAIGPPSYDFKVDHPFLFVITEGSTGTILFMGRVTDL